MTTRKPEKIVYPNGTIEYKLNGKLHRNNRPAVMGFNGYRAWYINGKRHREDGPAIVDPNNHIEWWFNGRYYIKGEDYTKYLLKHGLTKEISLDNLVSLEDL